MKKRKEVVNQFSGRNIYVQTNFVQLLNAEKPKVNVVIIDKDVTKDCVFTI